MANKQSQPTKAQIELLEVLYKYRFSNRQAVAETMGIKAGSSLHERMTVLLKHGYIGMRLEKRLKLLGTPAAYYLMPKGLKALQSLHNHEYITESVIRASYKDKTIGQAFINHTMNIHTCTNLLKRQYAGLKVFTKREMTRYSYFPDQLPDAFLSLPGIDSTRKRYFLDLISDAVPPYQLERRIAGYYAFFDEGGWEVSGTELPTLLLVGERAATERRLRRINQAVAYKYDDVELSVLTTTMPALQKSQEMEIWSDTEDPDDLQPL